MMTSMQRVLTALGHREPDKVPLFLLTTMHGAKEMGLSIREYYSRADYVVEGRARAGQIPQRLPRAVSLRGHRMRGIWRRYRLLRRWAAERRAPVIPAAPMIFDRLEPPKVAAPPALAACWKSPAS